ncbi:MAG: hypothetical protein IIA62_04120 [Nitrospinae bacterium]|nr:hypothetical protein [Nitrospinota bacterium]
MPEEFESIYKKLFAKLKTRKKFTIQKIEGNKIVIEQDEEICGEKEPKIFNFESAKELEKFMEEENQFERAIVQQLSGNEMPFR